MNRSKISQLFINLGAVLEYYDYLLFAFLAKILTSVFFPSIENKSFTINFLFFTLGSVMKIVGGLVFGYMSDVFGRKKVILCMSIMMAISTIIIGLMPYGLNTTIYVCLFFVLRGFQALSFGGEIPCATTLAYELENDGKRNSRVSHIFSGAAIGAIMATGMLSLLTFALDSNQVFKWGWRLPFLFGGVLGIFSFFLRKNLKETLSPNTSNNRLRDITNIFKEYTSTFIQLSAILLFPASLNLTNLYFPVYLTQHFGFEISKIYLAQMVSLIFSACFALLAGIFSRKKQIKNIYIILLLAFLAAQPLLIKLLINHTILSLILFMVTWQFYLTLAIVFSMVLILENLPMQIRTMANGFIYNLTFFIASFIPIIFNNIYSIFKFYYILFFISSSICLLSLISLLKLRLRP